MKGEGRYFERGVIRTLCSYPTKLFGCKCAGVCFMAVVVILLLFNPSLRSSIQLTTTPDTVGDVGFNDFHYKHLQRRLPQCIIIGARKAGTRALLGFLDLHPNIVTNKKEEHFFDRNENYKNGLEWYRNHMPLSLPDQVTMEKTPAYFHSEQAVKRVHEMNSSVRLILIVRDPVVRAVSDWYQLELKRLRNDGPSIPFETTVLRKDGSINSSNEVLQRSMYSVYYKKWTELFSPRQIHIVDGDAFVKNPARELEQIEIFLKIPHYLTEDMFVRNESKGFYCAVKTSGVKCLNDSKGRQHPDVDPQVLVKLRSFFVKFNKRFFKAIDKEFNWSSGNRHIKHRSRKRKSAD